MTETCPPVPELERLQRRALRAVPAVMRAPAAERDTLIPRMTGIRPSRFWQILLRIVESPPPWASQEFPREIRLVARALSIARRRRSALERGDTRGSH